MADNPNAEIVAVGTEILLGEITDSNSVYIARQLRDIGVNLYYMTTVGDNLGRIADAVAAALERADIVITTGGLGPTVDDMTRQAVAEALGKPLEFHQSLYDSIAERFRGFGVSMTENNRQQAYLPQAATLIENPVGTAPSFLVESARGVVISLPGVPREMTYLMQNAVLPYLLQRYRLGIILARILRTAGIGESSLDHLIGSDILNEGNPSVGLAAHHGAVDVRITAKAENRERATALLDAMQARLQRTIGEHIFGTDDATLEAVVLEQVRRHTVRLKLIEAGLPGVISRRLEDAGEGLDAAYFPSPAAACQAYGIDPGSKTIKESACAIAKSESQQAANDIAVVVFSEPGLSESADSEQGSAIAIAAADRLRYRVYGFGAGARLAEEWLARWGLANVWRLLKEEYGN